VFRRVEFAGRLSLGGPPVRDRWNSVPWLIALLRGRGDGCLMAGAGDAWAWDGIHSRRNRQIKRTRWGGVLAGWRRATGGRSTKPATPSRQNRASQR